MKVVYLDVCVLSRPYDDQSQLRIRLESDAVLLIVGAIQSGLYILKYSPVHFAEISAIEDARERIAIESFLLFYGKAAVFDLNVGRERAEYFCRQGLGVADAAHLSFAEACADVLISCDDRFVKKARNIRLGCELLTPVEFCEREKIR